MPWINALMATFWVIALMANLLIIYNFEKKNLDLWGFDFFYSLSYPQNKTFSILSSKLFFVFSSFFPHSRLAKTVPKSKRKLFFGLRRLRFGLKTRALSTEGREEKLLECTAFALVWKIRPRSGKSGMSCRVRLDLENRAASALSGKLCRDQLGSKICTAKFSAEMF